MYVHIETNRKKIGIKLTTVSTIDQEIYTRRIFTEKKNKKIKNVNLFFFAFFILYYLPTKLIDVTHDTFSLNEQAPKTTSHNNNKKNNIF